MAKQRQRGNGSGSLFQRKTGGPWIASWYNDSGKRVERSTFCRDKAKAARVLGKRTDDAMLRRAGVIDGRAEAMAQQARRPIDEHLTDWETSLRAKSITDKRIGMVLARVRRMLDACGFETLADIEPGPVTQAVQQMQSDGAAPRTINGHLQALRQFLRWAVAERRLALDPLPGVSMVKVVGQTRNRRPLDVAELSRLIDAAERGPAYRGLSGPDRAIAYRVATGSGLRRNELRTLRPQDFDLDDDNPAIVVQAAHSKRKRRDRQPIRPDLADLLRPWMAHKPAGRPVFALPDRTADMMRLDLRRARAWWIRATVDPDERRERRRSDFLTYHDGNGAVCDFHSLRGTFITALIRSGASVREAQELARHSDPKLTMNTYTRLGVHDLAGALDRLPAVQSPRPESETMRATGTDDASATRDEKRPQYTTQRERETLRINTKLRDESAQCADERSAQKPLQNKAQSDTVQMDAMQCGNTPGRTRTCDLRFRKAMLYPTELRVRRYVVYRLTIQ